MQDGSSIATAMPPAPAVPGLPAFALLPPVPGADPPVPGADPPVPLAATIVPPVAGRLMVPPVTFALEPPLFWPPWAPDVTAPWGRWLQAASHARIATAAIAGRRSS